MTRLSYTKLGGIVWRKYQTDGVPLSGAYEPDKDDIKTWTQEVERYLDNAAAYGSQLLNGKLAATAAGGALTIAIKTLAGADPSATDPVYCLVRPPTETDGDFDIYVLTAATSLDLTSGGTLGAVASQALRVWVTGIGDGATFRLGAVNCWDSTAGAQAVYGLDPAGVVTSVTMSSGGDSAGVMYANAVATAKGYSVLGFLEWTTGLATPGTWTAPSIIQLFGPGVRLPGEVVQRKLLTTGAVSTGTTTIPFDDSIPQNTEGQQVMSQAITPKRAANILRVRVRVQGAASAAGHHIAALFNDTVGANALAAVADKISAAGDSAMLDIEYMQVANQVTALTFTVRSGNSAAATYTFNGSAGARIFAGVMNSFLAIEEIMG